jgi:hypothetical protein
MIIGMMGRQTLGRSGWRPPGIDFVAPIAVADSFTVDFETPTDLDVLANDIQGTGDFTGIALMDLPDHGTAVVISGQVRYTPDDGYSGFDSFTYAGLAAPGPASNVVTVSITVADAPPVTYANGFAERARLRVPLESVDGVAEFTTFVMPFLIADPKLKFVANGGVIEHAQCYDLRFEDASGNKIPHFLLYHDGVNGVAIGEVRTTVSPAQDTSRFCYIGKSGLTLPEADASATYSGDVAAWHPATLVDLTGNGHSFTPSGISSALTVLGGAAYDGTDRATAAAGASGVGGLTALTISGKVKLGAAGIGQNRGVFAEGPLTGASGNHAVAIYTRSATGAGLANPLLFNVTTALTTSGRGFFASAANVQSTAVRYLHGTWADGEIPALWDDGVALVASASRAATGTIAIQPGNAAFGDGPSGDGFIKDGFLIGELGIWRLRSTKISNDLAATEGRAQADPGLFYGLSGFDEANVNQHPVAVPLRVSCRRGGTIDVDVLARCFDADGDTLSISDSANGSAGTVSVVSGQLRYEHDGSGSGTTTDEFSYEVSDGSKTGTARIKVTITPDTEPDAFAFNALTDQAVNTLVTSNTVTIEGISEAVPTSAVNGEISIAGGAWVTSGSISPGQTLQARHTTAMANNAVQSTVVTVGSRQVTFTSTTIASDDTPDPFQFDSVVNQPLNTLVTSNMVTIAGISGSVAVSVANGQMNVNGGGWTSSPTTISAGQTLQLRHTTSASLNTAVTTTVTVGTVQALFTSSTGSDLTPDPFSFSALTGQNLNTLVVSDTVTITGISAPVAIEVSNGEMSIAGGAFASADTTISAGQTLQLRHTTSSSHNTTVSTTVTVGDSSAVFSSTTSADITPDPFSFPSLLNQATGQVVSSDTVTITGISGSVAVSVTNGLMSINGGGFTSDPGTISSGQTLQLRHTTSGSSNTTVTTTVTVGASSAAFSSTTGAGVDNTPDDFSFTALTGQSVNTTATSNTVTITGITGAVAVSVSGGSMSINGAAFTTSAGTITSGQTLRLRHTTSSLNNTTVSTTVTVGTVSRVFSSTTVNDIAPDPFTFTNLTNQPTSTLKSSEIVTVTGISGSVAVSPNNCMVSVAGAAFTGSPTTITNGQTLQLRTTTSASADTAVTATITVGSYSTTWTLTTGSDTTPDTMTFTDLDDQNRSTQVTSNIITVTGISAAVPVTTSLGSASINGGTFSNSPGNITNGQTLQLRMTTDSAYSTAKSLTVTVGNGQATWTTTTEDAPAPAELPTPLRSITGVNTYTKLKDYLAGNYNDPVHGASTGPLAGDHVFLEDGTYSGANLSVASPGTNANPFVIRSRNKLKAIVCFVFQMTGNRGYVWGIKFRQDANVASNGRSGSLNWAGCNNPKALRCEFSGWLGAGSSGHAIHMNSGGGGCEIGYCYMHEPGFWTAAEISAAAANTANPLRMCVRVGGDPVANFHENGRIHHCWMGAMIVRTPINVYGAQADITEIGYSSYPQADKDNPVSQAGWIVEDNIFDGTGDGGAPTGFDVDPEGDVDPNPSGVCDTKISGVTYRRNTFRNFKWVNRRGDSGSGVPSVGAIGHLDLRVGAVCRIEQNYFQANAFIGVFGWGHVIKGNRMVGSTCKIRLLTGDMTAIGSQSYILGDGKQRAHAVKCIGNNGELLVGYVPNANNTLEVLDTRIETHTGTIRTQKNYTTEGGAWDTPTASHRESNTVYVTTASETVTMGTQLALTAVGPYAT